MSDIQDFEDLDELLEPDDLIAALALSRATRATEVTDPAEPYSAATRYDHHTASPHHSQWQLEPFDQHAPVATAPPAPSPAPPDILPFAFDVFIEVIQPEPIRRAKGRSKATPVLRLGPISVTEAMTWGEFQLAGIVSRDGGKIDRVRILLCNHTGPARADKLHRVRINYYLFWTFKPWPEKKHHFEKNTRLTSNLTTAVVIHRVYS